MVWDLFWLSYGYFSGVLPCGILEYTKPFQTQYPIQLEMQTKTCSLPLSPLPHSSSSSLLYLSHLLYCVMAARVVSFCFLFRTVEDYMSDTVDFVITNENWDNNFDEVRVIFLSTIIASKIA